MAGDRQTNQRVSEDPIWICDRGTQRSVTDDEGLRLKVFVAGQTPAAKRAVENLRAICAGIFETGFYDIEVVDIREHPRLAERHRILATPTVVRERPRPARRMTGDLSDREQVMEKLALTDPRR